MTNKILIVIYIYQWKKSKNLQSYIYVVNKYLCGIIYIYILKVFIYVVKK